MILVLVLAVSVWLYMVYVPPLQTGAEFSLFAQAVAVIRDVGPYGLFLGFFFGLYKEWWVMKGQHNAMKQRAEAAEARADRFEDLALQALTVTERATDAVENISRQPARDIRRRPAPTRSTDREGQGNG